MIEGRLKYDSDVDHDDQQCYLSDVSDKIESDLALTSEWEQSDYTISDPESISTDPD